MSRRWRWRARRAAVRRVRERYGDHARQRGEWFLPPGACLGDVGLPAVVLVHGGYWRPQYDLSLERAVAVDLAASGLLVWNVDYRPSSAPWPATLLDVAAAWDHLAVGVRSLGVDLARTAVVGHSAGGHLALWLASRSRLPAGAPGAAPAGAGPALVVAQAPVADLVAAAAQRLGSGAVQALLEGEPADRPERCAAADPLNLLPTGVRTVCLHAERDDVVPICQSEAYVAAAGGTATLVRVPGGHFEHLDPASAAGTALREALRGL